MSTTVAFMRLAPKPNPLDDIERAVADVLNEAERAGRPVTLELRMKLSVVLQELREVVK